MEKIASGQSFFIAAATVEELLNNNKMRLVGQNSN
jgi:hypothetical protein